MASPLNHLSKKIPCADLNLVQFGLEEHKSRASFPNRWSS